MSRRLMAILVALFTALGVVALTAPASAATATTTASTFTYTGTWGSLSSGEYYSNQTNATATSFFTVSTGGGTVSLRGVKHSGQGIEAVSIDGGAEVSVNMYSATTQNNVVIYTSPALAAGNHSIRARVTGTKDSLSTGVYASNTGADLSNGVFRSAPISNPSSVADSGFTYTDAWGSGGGEHWSGQVNATATVGLDVNTGGGTVSLRSTKNSANGIEAISIDGGAETLVDIYSTTYDANQTVWTSPVLEAGSHTLKVRVTGTKNASSGAVYASANGADQTNGTFTAPEGTVTPEPTQPPASGVTLNRDFDTCDASQWVGSSGLEAASPAHQFTAVSSPTRQDGGCSGRFEIHNNTSDYLNGGGYRALYGQYDSNEGTTGGTDFVYGFSFLMPQLPNSTQLWELHQRRNIYAVDPDIAIAPHAIVVRNGQIQYREMTGAANWNGSSWTGWTNYQDQKVLDTAVANTWYDIMVRIKASEGSDGITQVWIRRAGQAWTTAPTWQNLGPSLPYVPGGLDPNVPTKRSVYDPESGTGLTGLYLEAGIYNPGSTYSAGVSPFVTHYDNLRRYTDVASAKTGFPV